MHPKFVIFKNYGPSLKAFDADIKGRYKFCPSKWEAAPMNRRRCSVDPQALFTQSL